MDGGQWHHIAGHRSQLRVDGHQRVRLQPGDRGLWFMDTSAIHVLVSVNNRVMAGGGLLVLAGAQPVVARVLSLAGADEVMPVVGTVADALALT